MEIVRLASDREVSLNEIATVVETDPGLASRLLRYINSPLAGVSRQVTSVSHAVVFLGAEVVKAVALCSLLSPSAKMACAAFDYEAFRSESVARAVVLRHLAHKLKNYSPDEAFTCGLLSQIGRLGLAMAYPTTYEHVLSLVTQDDRRRLSEVEREVFDIDHNELAAEMMADWHLPTVVCDAVRWQDSPDEHGGDRGSTMALLTKMLNLSGPLSSILTEARIDGDTLAAAIAQANRLGVRPDVFAQVLDSINIEWCALGTILGVKTRKVPPFAELYVQAYRPGA